MARYYYASGERIPIELDEEQVAVDAERAGPAEAQALQARAGPSPRLPGGVMLLSRRRVGEKALEGLAARGALRPVYRAQGAALVALPEVRVEVDGEAQRQAVHQALSRSPHAVEIAEERPDGFVLRICSGSGDEALEVANFLHEAAHPAAASARLVRFVARPEPGR
ncbi:MAG: hypothetical protein HZB56_21660 [Deltaproteobacteria bacterium]|nr:hypothetical protein [Deltaproteobacteria bacterium]